MRVFAATVLFAALNVLATLPAAADWSLTTVVNQASVVASSPSCANVVARKVVCAVRNQDQQLDLYTYESGGWNDWVTTSAKVSSDPTCVGRGPSAVVCVVLDDASKLSYTIYNGTGWSPLALGIDSVFSSAPSCARIDADSIACATRASGFVLATFDSAVWSDPKFLGGDLISQPSCASNSDGKVVCVALNITSEPVAVRFNRLLKNPSILLL